MVFADLRSCACLLHQQPTRPLSLTLREDMAEIFEELVDEVVAAARGAVKEADRKVCGSVLRGVQSRSPAQQKSGQGFWERGTSACSMRTFLLSPPPNKEC